MTTWLNLPFQTQFRVVDGITVRLAHSDEPGGGEDQALLLSPWPESLFAFAPIWSMLAPCSHLVAVDLPGFGHSERRDALLSPQAMSGFLIRVTDSFRLTRPHVIAPGVGTAAALFAAARHPGRLASLVVGGGAAAVPLQLGGILRDWVEAPDLAPADPRPFLAGIERYVLPDAVLEDYLTSGRGNRFTEAMRYLRSYPEELPALRDLLPAITTPVQIIAGARDTAVPPVNAEFLYERLPHSNLDILDAGHFVWEDAADEYARLVTAWWAGGCTTTGNRSPS